MVARRRPPARPLSADRAVDDTTAMSARDAFSRREPELPVLERTAVRLVVLDVDHRVLLLHITEPMHPDQASCWELPGGGINPDEALPDAARRELFEETGIAVDPSAIRPPTWHRTVSFRHAGARRVQTELVVPIRVPRSAPAVDERGQSPDEKGTYLGYRWWTLSEIESSRERFFPGRLPELLPRFLRGERIEEPFEMFS